MELRLRARTALAVAAAALALLPVRAVAQGLDDVERQVDELRDEVDETTARFEEVRARLEAAEDELAGLRGRAGELEAEAARVEQDLAERTRAMFKFGGDPVLASLMASEGPQGAVERAALMAALTDRDRASLEAAVELRAQLDQTRALAESKAAELAELEDELAAGRDRLQAELAATQAVAADLRAVAARQQAVDRGPQQGVYACIHDQNSFVDSWGWARSGGRSHKGVDVMAPYDVPVYAFATGRISRLKQGGIAGNSLYLMGDDGNEYFYAHLAGYADGITVGTRVEAGQLVASNGDTGNARGTPHVHFEVHPGGGAAVNPYAWMAAACP